MARIVFRIFSFFCLAVMAVTFCGCVRNTDSARSDSTTLGTGSAAITGSVGGSASVGASSALERCDEPLGTLAVDDGSSVSTDAGPGRAYGDKVMTVEPLIRLAAQQSGCFVITSAGNLRTDSRLQRLTNIQRDSGEYRANSNQHKGQRVAVDYFLEPSIVINNETTNKKAVGAAVLGILSPALGAVAGAAIKETKVSVVTLSLFDVRSSLQLSVSEGSSSSNNYASAMAAFGGPGAVGLGGLSVTPEGKATIAAFLDAYNKLVIALRNYKAQDVKGGMGTGGRLHVN